MGAKDIKEYEFKKGQSGNPAGRPRGAKNRSTIARKWLEAVEKHKNPITGQMEDMTQEDIITLAQIIKARKQNSMSYKVLLDSAYGSPDQNITTQNLTKLDLSDIAMDEIERVVNLIDAIDNRNSNGL